MKLKTKNNKTSEIISWSFDKIKIDKIVGIVTKEKANIDYYIRNKNGHISTSSKDTNV